MAYTPDYDTADIAPIFSNGLGTVLLVVTNFLVLIVLIALLVWAVRVFRRNK